VAARAGMLHRDENGCAGDAVPGRGGARHLLRGRRVLALVLRSALRVMSPTSENTSILIVALIAAGTALAAHFGGSAPLAALLGRPAAQAVASAALGLAAPAGHRRLAAHHADVRAGLGGGGARPTGIRRWPAWCGLGARGIAKIAGVSLANFGSGTSWRQASGTGCAMAPMSSDRAAAGVAVRHRVDDAGPRWPASRCRRSC
jgi:hypothetical protein